jgi:poly(A) polymerase
VLIASTPVKEQYTDWIRLVESKIRHLVLNLEKNQHISLAHVNPQGYQQTKEKYRISMLHYDILVCNKFLFSKQPVEQQQTDQPPVEVNVHSTLWFIGLEFQITNNELVDLNLTDTIQSFTDLSKIF